MVNKGYLWSSPKGHKGISTLKPGAALKHIEHLREISFAIGNAGGLRQAIGLGSELDRKHLNPSDKTALHCSLASAWANLRALSSAKGRLWGWEQHEIENELMHLRRALNRDALRVMPREQASTILSDIATLLNHVGRFSEALEYWDKAVAWTPELALARGKRGYALTHYAHVLYENSHVQLFLEHAHSDFKEALSSELDSDEGEHFHKRLMWVESRLKKRIIKDVMNQSVGETGQEEAYRRWCLKNRLFLNPINDLGPYPAGARDNLVPPDIEVPRSRGTFYRGFFNQMKQSYVSARYLYYEGLNSSEPHYSDRDVMLFDAHDCSSLSLSVEKIKAAYSMAYGILDRTAGFLNRYLGLGIPPEDVTFRTLWYNSQTHTEGLREEFQKRRNWPLRGLFWLSKDLYENGQGLGEPISPEAQELAEIRFNLKHNFLNLIDPPMPSSDTKGPPPPVPDSIELSVYRGDFEAKTLRLLKTARATQMYLCFALHSERKK
jgi:tetratricopeptide (TPR) repeat protein